MTLTFAKSEKVFMKIYMYMDFVNNCGKRRKKTLPYACPL